MANLTESPTWESGIYRIETTDPILGGETGTANIQAKQLANRTLWLKLRADQVDAARGSYGSLQSRLAAIESATEALGPDMQNMVIATLKYALDQAAQANWGVRSLRELAQQEGEVTIVNRGVVDGCVVTKSTTATRNLHISAGRCFAKGRIFAVADGDNAASVPSNPGSGSVTVYAYLYQDAGGFWRLAVTPIGTAVPADGIRIYDITIPARNTDATDPYLAHVTLTSVRRLEPQFPLLVNSPAQITVPIRTLSDTDYRIDFDVVSAVGAPCDARCLVVSSRATNGFTVQLASAADDVTVRFRVSKLNQ